MALASNRKQIEQRLEAVIQAADPKSNVIRGRPNYRDPEAFVNMLTRRRKAQNEQDRVIHAWLLYWTALEDERPGAATNVPLGKVRRNYTYQLDGFYSYSDDLGSHDEFSDIVDNVLNTIGEKVSLVGKNTQWLGAPSVELDIDELGNYLVHTARFTLQFSEQISASFS